MTQTTAKDFFVYLLESTDGGTYVGATVDLDHRLRQHNREIKGGAHRTSKGVLRGEQWMRVCYVKNFPDWKSALQFEWKWKNVSRRLNGKPLEKRINALNQILRSERSTSKATPFYTWPNPPEPIFECTDCANIYKQYAGTSKSA